MRNKVYWNKGKARSQILREREREVDKLYKGQKGGNNCYNGTLWTNIVTFALLKVD